MKDIKSFLETNSYIFISTNEVITVSLLKFLEVKIITENKRLYLEANTIKWTGFAGFVCLNLNTVLKLNTVGLFLLLIVGELSKTPLFIAYDYTYILIIAITLNLMWFFHSLIVFQNFKSKIEMVYYLSHNNKTHNN